MLAISYRLLLTVLAWPSLQHACGDQVANSGATVSDTGFSREYQLNELKAKQAALKSHSQGEGANHTVPSDTPVTPFTLRKLEENEIIFNGYHCRAAHADKGASCKASSENCAPLMPAASPEHWMTNVSNRRYDAPEVGRAEVGTTAGAGLWSAPDSSINPERIPVLGFVVAKGAALVKRGILSVDFPVSKFVVVQMGDDFAVTRALDEVKQMRPYVHIVKLGNLGCAAGWNRVIMEDPHAPYYFILNFDISFPPGSLAQIHRESSEVLASTPRVGFIHFWYHWGGFKPEWSAFILRRETLHDIGFFDENVYPVNTEDLEYSLRMAGNEHREPWYRHLLPGKRPREGCPRLYVHHGQSAHEKWSGGTRKMHKQMRRSKFCNNASTSYKASQSMRGKIQYVARKWGLKMEGRVNFNNYCVDTEHRGAPGEMGGMVTVEQFPYYKHPTGNEYGLMPYTPFLNPYGHPGLPVWFWALDPSIRRCSLGEIPAYNCTTRALIIPFHFSRVTGLPAKCVDAFELCTSALSSLRDPSLLERLHLVPTTRDKPEACSRMVCTSAPSSLRDPPLLERLHLAPTTRDKPEACSRKDLDLSMPPPLGTHTKCIEGDVPDKAMFDLP